MAALLQSQMISRGLGFNSFLESTLAEISLQLHYSSIYIVEARRLGYYCRSVGYR